jgi:transposase
LPLSFGQAATHTHDDKRHGTTSLFAALEVATGKVIGQLKRRHRSVEFLQFLKRIDEVVASDLTEDQQIHLIMDHYGTPKTEKVRAWFAAHPRYHVHFTPTSAAWLNQVERFFGHISSQWIKRSAYASVADIEQSIRDYIDRHNAGPKLFCFSP